MKYSRGTDLEERTRFRVVSVPTYYVITGLEGAHVSNTKLVICVLLRSRFVLNASQEHYHTVDWRLIHVLHWTSVRRVIQLAISYEGVLESKQIDGTEQAFRGGRAEI